MANIYTVTSAISQPITSGGLLNTGAVFPPSPKLIISPLPNMDMTANQFRVGFGGHDNMVVNYEGELNSQTQWPSRIEWIMEDLDTPDPTTISGLKEFPAFWKVVFEDSMNPSNNPNFTGHPNNQVYVWVYFGKNRITPVAYDPNGAAVNFTVDLDIDWKVDILPISDTINPINTATNINNSNI